MRRVPRCSVLILLFAVVAGGPLLAHDETPAVEPAHPEHKSSVSAAEQATDPSAILTQMGFFYWTAVDRSGSGTTDLTSPALPLQGQSVGETFLFQPVLPPDPNLVKKAVSYPGLRDYLPE